MNTLSMQPQFRIFRDAHHGYYFQFFSADGRFIFESIHFDTRPLCAKGINELKMVIRLEEYIHKTEHEGGCSFIITNKKKVIIGSGKHHCAFMTRNLDIRTLQQELPRADIVERFLEAV